MNTHETGEQRPELVAVSAIAERTGINPHTVRRRLRVHKVPTWIDPRDNRIRLVNLADVEGLFEPRLVGASPLASAAQ